MSENQVQTTKDKTLGYPPELLARLDGAHYAEWIEGELQHIDKVLGFTSANNNPWSDASPEDILNLVQARTALIERKLPSDCTGLRIFELWRGSGAATLIFGWRYHWGLWRGSCDESLPQ